LLVFSITKAPKITVTVGSKKNKNGELDTTSVADAEQENFSAMFEQSADEEDVNADETVDSTNNNDDPNEPYRFACCMCVKICETEEELLEHVKDHDIPPREYQPGKTVECRLCLKRFSKTKNYNNHIKCVYEEKKLCPLCGMSLYERHFPDHMAGHADPETQEVHKQQKQQRQSKRASRGNTNVQQKKACPDCGREFLLTTHLNIHIKAVHLKEKPYVVGFILLSFLQQH
jgi:ribosomal protein S27AE